MYQLDNLKIIAKCCNTSEGSTNQILHSPPSTLAEGYYFCTARALRNVLEQSMGKRSVLGSLAGWLLDAHLLPTLRGEDDGGRHRIII